MPLTDVALMAFPLVSCIAFIAFIALIAMMALLFVNCIALIAFTAFMEFEIVQNWVRSCEATVATRPRWETVASVISLVIQCKRHLAREHCWYAVWGAISRHALTVTTITTITTTTRSGA